MPERPARPCRHPGCPALVPRGGGLCPDHRSGAHRRYDSDRLSAHRRGYTRQWSRERARQLDREPLCRACRRQGRVTAASEVDHIVPARIAPSRFLDPANLQSLCRACHAAKTWRERTMRGGGG